MTVDVDIDGPAMELLMRWQRSKGTVVVSPLDSSSLPFSTDEEVTSVEKIPGPHSVKFQPISDKIDAFLKNGMTSLIYLTVNNKMHFQ